MDKKAYLFLTSSFLQPLLDNPEVTDIAFNGEAIFYQHNQLGRLKSEICITKEAAFDFIRQLANLTEQLFSYSSPILDVSIERFRINAVHPAIGRKHFERATTFSIRIGHVGKTAIEEDPCFMPPQVIQLFLAILKLHASIVIAGKTGTGKTELQKYLLQQMEPNSRIVVIDNVLELESVSSPSTLHISLWHMSDRVN
ncbi:MAG: ATPase, T2SS/T4P/T4SS family, partial [Firmicutes bacterium]|nr:ATPase, T2SS/T4P/T4SS family [Bacillota bacterium]